VLEHSRLLFSPETFAELETRLWRPKFDRYLSPETRRLLLHDFKAVAEWVTLPEPSGLAYSQDPDDDKFIHTALIDKADWLISGDTDLLKLLAVEGLTILSPAQALVVIGLNRPAG
jgi:putative PIN family toxin of toxin-antitoxin system